MYGENDDILGLNKSHRLTRGVVESIAYTSQLISNSLF